MKFDDPRIGKATREKYFQRGLYNSNIQRDWTPVFEVERTYVYRFKMYQRIQFPLRAAAAKTVHKTQGITEDEIVVDLTQYKGTRKVPHIHYVAFSRVRKLENLYILNLNEAAIHLDERVTVEMQRLRTQAYLQLIRHCIKLIPAKSNWLSIMQGHYINILKIYSGNQMCWLQMLLGLLNLDCAQGMKMFISPSINSDLLD